MAKEDRVRYFIDVRSTDEFQAGHIPGFWSVPGGQAVQRADDTVGIKASHVVFCCDDLVRAVVTASWYKQMGFRRVYAVEGGTTAWQAAGLEVETGPAEIHLEGIEDAERMIPAFEPANLAAALGVNPHLTILFVDTSREFADGHIPGARWLIRSWLEPKLSELAPDLDAPVLITDVAGEHAKLAALTMYRIGYRRVATLHGGMRAWREAGLAVEKGLAGIMEPPVDVVPAGTDRSYSDMVQYLRWEEALGKKYEQLEPVGAS